jgi:hypothetical protein
VPQVESPFPGEILSPPTLHTDSRIVPSFGEQRASAKMATVAALDQKRTVDSPGIEEMTPDSISSKPTVGRRLW